MYRVRAAAAGDGAGGVLLHLLAGRPGHPAALPALRLQAPVLRNGSVRALPPPRSSTARCVHQLPRLGRHPAPGLAVQGLHVLVQ